MLYKKKGFPEEGDIALCTVTGIRGNSVFARMDEYNDLAGMIHVSEVSPGRIRNIRDFVKEGKTIICKVLKTYPDRGHVDLSLRRVSEGIRRSKSQQIKREQTAEKIIEFVAKKLKIDVKELHKTILEKISGKYDYIYPLFEEISKDETTPESVGIDKNIAKDLTETIKQRIKPLKIAFVGTLKLKSYDGKGIETIKEALSKTEEGTEIKYVGAGSYKIQIISEDFKKAEKTLETSVENIIDFIEKHGGEGEFKREEAKKEAVE